MLRYVFRKMLNKKWMILSLLVGNILLISIAMSDPMYTAAVTQRLLTDTMTGAYQSTGEYPALLTMEGSLSARPTESTVTEYMAMKRDMANLPANMRTEALYEITYSVAENCNGTSYAEREDESDMIKVEFASLTDLEKHAVMVEGKICSDTPDADGVYDVMVSKTTLIKRNLILGEELEFKYLYAPDGTPLRVRVAGVFVSDNDKWWVNDESFYTQQLFMPEALFETVFLNIEDMHTSVKTTWYTLINYEKMRADDVPFMISALKNVSEKYNMEFFRKFNTTCYTLLVDYKTEADQASATLKVLQVPIFALLIAFIFMVSRQILEIEQSEISVFKSRGASSWQVECVYILQSLILAALGFAISLPVSKLICSAIGSATAFLEFGGVNTLNSQYTVESLIYAAGAVLVSVLAMALPAIGFARRTIVDAKRDNHSRSQYAWWQKFYLDFVLLAVSIYAWYSFSSQKDMLIQAVSQGAALDPLLYISSSLFAVSASLIMVRVIPLIASLIFKMGKKGMSGAMYASYLQVLRSRRKQTFMMTFLMLTIAIGILNADTACTVNDSEESQIRYTLGADVVLQEAWKQENGEYVETDIMRYEGIDGVESVAKVFTDDDGAAAFGSKSLTGVRLMGIDTKSFGQTAYMKDNLTDTHFFTQLNSISQNLSGALVSRNFETNLDMKVGDSFTVKASDEEYVNVTVMGFVDYFPAYNPREYVTNEDGTQRVSAKCLVGTNYGYLTAKWGLKPYEIWIKSPSGADSIYAFADESGTRYWRFDDIFSRLKTLKNSPAIQGTNGILTLSFIIGLILCAVGFLIFWILTIRSRALQFGIYRAMGMSVRELIKLLLNEQMWLSVFSMIAGAIIGYITSFLFIPLIQIAYSSVSDTLPLTVTRDIADHIRLFVIIFIVMCVCIYVLVAIIKKLKVAQALKLGED